MVTMPQAKKLPGQAVDRRNGQKATIAASPLKRFGLPARPDGRPLDARTRRVWKALFGDDRLASVLLPVDREVVIRWAHAVDDQIKALALAWESPVTKGSMDQEVPSPYFAIAKQAEATALECERQLGIGALNRARLGVAVLTEAKLADLDEGFPGDADEPDPRLS